MKVHLVDGTYELFRHYYGAPAHLSAGQEEVGATRAVVGSLLGMLETGATHMGVATDHVIESWRNRAWPTYKSSAGVPEDLLAQFPLFEQAMTSMGLVVWAMTELEADDALASAAAVLADDPRTEQVLICTPDKDLGQCVEGPAKLSAWTGARTPSSMKTPSGPASALAPGRCPTGWRWWATAPTASRVWPVGAPRRRPPSSARYASIEAIPPRASAWKVALPAGRVASLAAALGPEPRAGELFKKLATCVVDRDLLPAGPGAVDSLEWQGPEPGFADMCQRLEAPELLRRAERLASARPASQG